MFLSLSDVQEFLLALHDNRIETYCHVASYALVVYDYFLTLGLEIELIWPTPLTLGTVLYYITRYSAFIDGALLIYARTAPASTSISACNIFFRASGALIVIGTFFAEMILILRTVAMWGGSQFLCVFFLAFVIIALGPIGYLSIKTMGHHDYVTSIRPDLLACVEAKLLGSIIFVDYILVALFESLIFTLTMYKWYTTSGRRRPSTLMSTLIRDGMLYYVYLIAISSTNIVVLAMNRHPGPSLILMQRNMHAVFATRILLNLRQAICRDRVDPSPSGMHNFTTIVLGSTWLPPTQPTDIELEETEIELFRDRNVSS